MIVPEIENAVRIVLEMAEYLVKRQARMIELEGTEDFDVHDTLTSESYWNNEREDVTDWLIELFGDETVARAAVKAWIEETTNEYESDEDDD